MAEEERQIFRQESLDKLSSPERLDQMLRIVKPQSWILLLALSLGACLVVLWAIFGLVPDTAHGPAILVVPQQVSDFHAPASGQIASIEVSPGEHVEKDDVLATLDLPTLEKELEVQKEKRELVMDHGQQRTAMEQELARLERGLIGDRRDLNRIRMNELKTEADRYKQDNEAYLEQRRSNLETARKALEPVAENLEARVVGLEQLREGGIGNRDRLIVAQSDLVNIQIRLADLVVTEEALNLRESDVEEYYNQRVDIIRDLEIATSDLDMREIGINRRLEESRLEYDRELQEVEQAIARLVVQLEEDGKVKTEHAGRVLEITAAVGHQVGVGQSLGKMMIQTSTELMALAYFSIEDGKKVNVGQDISVSPSTVERERYGGIEGRVESVSDYPVGFDAVTHEIGDQEMARDLLAGEPRIQVRVILERDETTPTGYRWTTGTGPDDDPPTPATTAEVRVTLEQRAPITLVLPFLNRLFGQ